MSVLALIRECRDAGIHLQPRGDRLRVEAPAGTVTPELRQRLAKTADYVKSLPPVEGPPKPKKKDAS